MQGMFPKLLGYIFLFMLGACNGGGGDSGDPARSSLTIGISGLPAGVDAAITVSGPGAYQQTLNRSQTLNGLVAGSYTVVAAAVTSGATLLQATPASQQVQVDRSGASVAITYAAASPLVLNLQPFISGLAAPVFLTAPPGDTRQFIVERAGRIRIAENGQLQDTPFLDMRGRTSTDGERGLLSMAFHPRYAENGYFFIYYTDLTGNIVLERLQVAAGAPGRADPLSSLVLLTIPHPGFTNHYGGLLSFGTDGFLYAGTGDGGGAGDPARNAQNLNSLLGKLLRIDVNQASPTLPYTIPANNPFAGQAGARGEIWAYGLRNPWRYAFDAGQLYIADVGQDQREEIEIVASAQGGLNFGWNIMEGGQCYNTASCDRTGLTLPLAEYGHDSAGGCSITGG